MEEWERPLVEAALSAAIQEARNSLMGSQFVQNRLPPPPPPPLPLPEPLSQPSDPRLVSSSAATPRQELKSCRDRSPTPAAPSAAAVAAPVDTAAAPAAAAVVPAAAAVADAVPVAAAAAAAAPPSPVVAPGGTRAPVVLPPSSLAWRSLVEEATDTIVSGRAATTEEAEPGAVASPVVLGSAGAPIEVESSPSAPPSSSSYCLRPRLRPEKSPDCVVIKHKNPVPPRHKKVWDKKDWEGYQAFLADLAKPQEKPKVNKKRTNKNKTKKTKKSRKGEVLPDGDLVDEDHGDGVLEIAIGAGRPGEVYKEEEDEAFSADSDDSSYSE